MLRRSTAALVLAVLAPLLLVATGCSKAEEASADPAEVLAEAKQQLDDTAGVQIALATSQLPQGVDGLKAATGIGTHAPAFQGDVELTVNDLAVEVPVVAVDGLVWAKLPFTKKFSEIDPAEYGAPDPAQLMSPETGLSSWLTRATGVEQGNRIRDGQDVLTSYVGTLAGDVVAASIPGAQEGSDFRVTFNVVDGGQLRSIVVAGPFYEKGGEVEYTCTFTGYGTEQDIARP